MTYATIIRVRAPLRMARKGIRAYTVSRPEGWADTPRDYARWRIMLRREGRNETNYINKH